MKKKLSLLILILGLGLFVPVLAQPHPNGNRPPQTLHAKMPPQRITPRPMPHYGIAPRPPRHITPIHPYPRVIYRNPFFYNYYGNYYPIPYYPYGFGASIHISI